MGIFNLFKKEKPAIKVKKISLNEVNEILLNKKQEIKIDEANAINIIKNRINSLIIDFESEISVINNIDLGEKKAEEKVKLIVKENLDRFLIHLKELKNNLENLQGNEIQHFIKNLDLIFSQFKVKSSINFEKATFLIGKELGNVMKSIKAFYADLNNILNENRRLIEILELLEKAEKSVKEIDKFEKIKNEMNMHIKNIEITKQKNNMEIKNLKNKVKNLKESEEYNKSIARKNELNIQKNELEKDFIMLEGMINFKELASIHHSIEEHMTIINDYRDNFHDAFKKDNGKSIANIVIKNKDKIQDNIKGIAEKQEEISNFKIERDKVLDIENEIKIIEDKIVNLSNEKLKVEKKLFHLDGEANNFKNILNKELVKINVEVA